MQKIKRVTDNSIELSQKMVIAECFNNQYMYRQGFKAWLNYYQSNYENIKKMLAAKTVSQAAMKKRFLGRWAQASWRPLSKIDSIDKMDTFIQKSKFKRAFEKLVDYEQFMRHVDQMVE